MTPLVIRPVKWQKFEKFLLACGCEFVRQKGGHRVYKKADLLRPIIVPAHSFDLPVSVIKSNLRTLGISDKDYLDCINDLKKRK